jgi:hypothetical protein
MMEGEPMRKFGFLALTALTMAGIGTTQARIAGPVSGTRIDVLQTMATAKEMPTDHFVDYSFVFEK